MYRSDDRVHWGDLRIQAWSHGNALVAVSWIIVLVGLAAAVAGLDSVSTAAVHILYLPILIAAVRFGHLGALVVAVPAGLLTAPLLASAAGVPQTVGNVVVRTMVFVIVGQIVAALNSRSIDLAVTRIADRKVRTEIRAGLAADEFVPYFQPVVDLRSDTIVSVEALARWQHPDGSLTAPAEFIPAAERTGLISDLGIAILEQTCEQLAKWRAVGTDESRALSVSVNLSRVQLEDDDLVEKVRAILDRTGVPADRLVLEVTETALAADPDMASACLCGLRELGVRLALDDFGVGQSSLSMLHEFPIDILKIDQSFVGAIDRQPDVKALIRAIASMAHDLELSPPVIEGIETADQRDIVIDLGCGFGQGYLFARPLPADEATHFLRTSRAERQTTPSL